MIDEYQDFALGNFLCQWNQDVTFTSILEALRHDDCELDIEKCALCAIKEEIIIWEAFEYHPRDYVAEQIELMHHSVKRRFIPREDETMKKCTLCRGRGYVKKTVEKWDTPHAQKILAIMEKYKLTTYSLAKILGVSQGTAFRLYAKSRNKTGRIKDKYFKILESKGYL